MPHPSPRGAKYLANNHKLAPTNPPLIAEVKSMNQVAAERYGLRAVVDVGIAQSRRRRAAFCSAAVLASW